MKTRTLLAGLVGIGVLTGCVPAEAADRTRVNAVAVEDNTGLNGCVISRLTANQVLQTEQGSSQKFVQLTYSSINNCTGQRLGAGAGKVPFEVMNGSFAAGAIYVNFDGHTVNPGFSQEGPPAIINLLFEKKKGWDSVNQGSGTEKTTIPGPTKIVRVTNQRKASFATVQGTTSFADFRQSQARMNFSVETRTQTQQ